MSQLAVRPRLPGPRYLLEALRSQRYAAHELAIAALLFYFPWANFPQPRFVRTALLHVPIWGSGNERAWTITPFLVPETLVVAALAIAIFSRRSMRERWQSADVVILIASSALVLAGGAVSLLYSSYPGISIAGWTGRLTIFLLALVIAFSAPKPNIARLWVYAAIAGTSVMCLAGLFFFIQSFGVPTSLASLPGYRVSPGILNYQKATYGAAGNTVDLLVLTIPSAMALAVAKSTGRAGRILLAASIVLMLANMTISFERWGWVCLVMAGVLILVFNRHNLPGRRVLVGATAVGLVVAAIVFGQLGGYFEQALNPSSGSNIALRFQAWSHGLNLFLAKPWGIGLGTEGVSSGLPATAGHNLFIDIAVEGGFLAAIGSLLWALRNLQLFGRVVAQASPDDEIAFALLLGTFSFLVFGLFFNSLLYLSGLMVWLAFWWCFPVIASTLMSAPSADKLPIARSVRVMGVATPPEAAGS